MPARSAYLEKTTTSLARVDLCTCGAIRDALQDEGVVQISRHNTKSHSTTVLASRPKAKGEFDRKFIRYVTSISNVPIFLVRDHRNEVTHVFYKLRPLVNIVSLLIGK